jgi:hypothetical protein
VSTSIINERKRTKANVTIGLCHENTCDNRGRAEKIAPRKNIIGNAVAFRITAFYLWSPNAGLLPGCYFSRAGIG